MTPTNGRRPGKVLFAAAGFGRRKWVDVLASRRTVVTPEDDLSDRDIRFAVAWKPEQGLLASLPGLEVIFSLGAGVDHLFADPTLPDVPIVRVVDPNLTTHMVEYVCWRVLDHHRLGPAYRAQQGKLQWRPHKQNVAREVSVGIMGLGELGRAAAAALLALGFRVNGWSRSGGAMPGVRSYAGPDGLTAFLGQTDILVVLLPLTPATEGIIDYDLLRGLRRTGPFGSPVLINAGRGLLQRDEDICRALDDGTLAGASLDVFAVEPLPDDSPLWAHPAAFVTPHIAAESDPNHLVPPMLDQMDAYERGSGLSHLVDREAGY